MFDQFFSGSTPPKRVEFVSHNLLSSRVTAQWLKPLLPNSTPIDFVNTIEHRLRLRTDALVVLDLDYIDLQAQEVALYAELLGKSSSVVGISAVEGNEFVEEFSRLAPAVPVYRIDQCSSL